MARDYTKYNVEGLGENLNKRKLVFEIVKNWAGKNNPSLEELQNAFPDELQGKKGVVRKESEVKDPKRFNMKEPLSIKNGLHVVVSNQWGENILDFIAQAKTLGYSITENSNVEEVTLSSNLTAEQIAEFKKQEAKIKGDYKENSWEASSLYDDLIEAGDTAWADQILQKIAAAAESFFDINTVCDRLKERNETDRFLATAKKAEAMAEDTADMVSLAELVSDTDKDWTIELYKKAEDKAGSSNDILRIADEVKEIDKDWLIRLYQKAETLVRTYRDCVYFADKVKAFDKDLVIRLYQKAEQKADNSHDLCALTDLVFSYVDRDWAIKLIEKAEGKAKEFHDFLLIGEVYGKADGLADKDKARTFFEKAIPLIDCDVFREQLLESAQECLGNEDAFTKKIAQSPDVEPPTKEYIAIQEALQDVSIKLESFSFSTSNAEEIRNHIAKIILSKDKERCQLFKQSAIDYVNSNNCNYWIIPFIQSCLKVFTYLSEDDIIDDFLDEIDLMYPNGKELDVNPKNKYSLFYCCFSQTFKLDEDKDEEQEFFEILIKHFSDAQNIDDTGDDFYHTCITTLYCTICKMCQEDIAQDELVDLLLAVFNDQYLKDAEQGDFIWGVISETLTSLGVDLDEYEDESNLWRDEYVVNFDDVATYLIENDVFDHDYIPCEMNSL